ncbi:hypothetical protein LJY25_17020 [Hymenobacter sp. BT175]|uniref:DUF3592 domain-containing protein n=1 Tax=Hymenobacter translucens TaxID=2886507 RepID=UPI001D0E9D1D|nr:hypothetical protein [Hymenobacter translucens]MCC2548154.1 hypothetical protein [Hymenobacter translucens]
MPAPDLNKPPTTTRQALGLVLGLVFCIALSAGIIYFVITKSAEKREAILKNPGYTAGIITRVRRFKGKRISVQYTVGGVAYSIRTRVPAAFLRTHQKGDTTAVIYSKADPANAVLKVKLRSSTN